jgi:uncharacterized damage-inducible protein DinB
MLATYLDWHRATLQHKCAGLDGAQLTRRSCPPSNLSLLGLVRHLTDVERGWFSRGAGHDAPPLYYSDTDPEGDIEILGAVGDDEVRAALRTWQEECDRSRAVVAAVRSLDDTAVDGDHTWRWILLHMLEEYARHNGHADLLREAIDGATGT